ncbi:amidohydrolase family protein [Mucilaginibacter sp. X5P1]|uniref:amidohydrolase family protein n=1 Tax=Mucilaginibacter sp. X5P1 TaxID=2723088 RepID=UPI00162009BE|nr:amidohydrolase family protein [Mucilaginibacter sp. X5P1]MBB6136856.1 L-fuconolactonase [Mucilaginibacter sp. X5P1]
MLRIDSHQHFWKYDPVEYDWIDDSMAVIRKDFLPGDLEPVLKSNGFDGCIIVQSHQSEQENDFQLANADNYNFIKGVVGWVDLQSANIGERLTYYNQFEKMKGFRHVLQGEPQRDMMLQSAFLHGISLLKKYNYTYDILIFPDQLKYTAKFVAQFPDQPFVIDHIAKPNIKQAEIADWEKDIKAVAQFENVFCKVSGMVTEADWQNWKPADFNPYLDVIADNFGTDRLMFGSDWPVCKIAAEYEQVAGIIAAYFSAFSKIEQENIFGGNAARFYNI